MEHISCLISTGLYRYVFSDDGKYMSGRYVRFSEKVRLKKYKKHFLFVIFISDI